MSLNNEFNEAGYDRLKQAIIMRACNDYFICKRALLGLTGDGKKHPAWGHISNTQKTLDECIEFFNGAWYRTLTNNHPGLSGTRVMKRLDEMVEDLTRYPSMGDVFKYGVEEAEPDAYKSVG